MKPGTKVKIKKELREWLETIVIAMVLAFFIRTYFIQAFKIPSGSMLETLQLGDHLFVNKFLYGTKVPFTKKMIWKVRDVQRGDVVVFKYPVEPKKDFVKRAIGLPGDEVEIHNKIVFVNNVQLNEPYSQHKDSRIFPDNPDIPVEVRSRDNLPKFKVPPGQYFMMGDNRDNSLDSRFWGLLPEENIRGKAWFIYWPLTRIRVIK
ncbi:MAG: signal peptidase I [bacterium]|nr:signal peptidase I [bacterium]MDD5354078.1 signal peptidase I [bacterium]MDD5755750.1 signal peptidase I [bacterium]